MGGGGSSWVGVYAWLRHGLPGLASSFLRPSIVPPVVSVFTLSDAWNWLGSIPSTAGSPGEPVCRGVDLLPPGWDGRFPGGGVFGDAPRSTPSSGGSSPFGLRLVYRLARSPRLLFFGAFTSFRFRVAALTGLLFRSSCACLVSSGTAASRMFECGLALSGLGGCSPLGVLPPRFPLGCLLPLWVASAAAWGLVSHFSLPFSFGVVVAPWFLVGILQRFSPPGGFLLQFS